jgi:methionyl-tRNA synthetase
MPKTAIMTAIPYVNSTPHIGNILTTLSGDVTARYHRLLGEDVFFAVGTDENGQKIKDAAEAKGQEVQAFVEDIANNFLAIFKNMGMEYDAAVRTSLDEHKIAAQAFFTRLQERGYIYPAQYEGWYDVSTETYFKESDLVDGKSPDGNEVRWVSEKNYFFKLSEFTEPLKAHIEANPSFVIPESRRNEVLSFLNEGLRDQCVSRKNNGWGIPVPGDDSQVIYVWFDALINYITATGWPNNGWQEKWPALVQWLGKDILTRFHATLWPAMLMGAGIELPKHVVAHAWILLGNEKISKSKGNVIEPLELAEETARRTGCAPTFAVDVVRYYIIQGMGFDNDTSFTYQDYDKTYNSDLANDLGNALNRSLAMAHKFVSGVVPSSDIEQDVVSIIAAKKLEFESAMARFRLDLAARSATDIIRFANKYIDTRAPWQLAKNNSAELGAVLRSMLLCIRTAAAMLSPIMPNACKEIDRQLGLPPLERWDHVGDPTSMPCETKLGEPIPIFPRLDLQKNPPPIDVTPDAKPHTQPEPKMESQSESTTSITIDEFMKVQFKVGRIFEAEPIEGSDKLYKLQVHIGEEKRQIVAGIKAAYAVEDLIGRQVAVVVNLKPAKLRGVESQGMLLAAVDADGAAILLQPDREAPEGSQIR